MSPLMKSSVTTKGYIVSTTHRALAIVAVIVTLVTVAARVAFEPGTFGGWFSYAPLYSTNGAFLNLFTLVWLATTTIAAPVVSTFGAVVAGQERRWGWLVAFILLGALGVFGAPTYFLLEIYLGLALQFRSIGAPTDFYAPIILQALPGLAALIFVATSLRRARTAGAVQPA